MQRKVFLSDAVRIRAFINKPINLQSNVLLRQMTSKPTKMTTHRQKSSEIKCMSTPPFLMAGAIRTQHSKTKIGSTVTPSGCLCLTLVLDWPCKKLQWFKKMTRKPQTFENQIGAWEGFHDVAVELKWTHAAGHWAKWRMGFKRSCCQPEKDKGNFFDLHLVLGEFPVPEAWVVDHASFCERWGQCQNAIVFWQMTKSRCPKVMEGRKHPERARSLFMTTWVDIRKYFVCFGTWIGDWNLHFEVQNFAILCPLLGCQVFFSTPPAILVRTLVQNLDATRWSPGLSRLMNHTGIWNTDIHDSSRF